MLPKELKAPRGGGSFAELVRYLVNPKGTQERVGRIAISNCHCGGDDWGAAIAEVAETQSANTRAKLHTHHVLVSFRPGDEPDEASLKIIERRLCAAIGLGEHQRVSVLHHDTDNQHLHIAINRIHPKTHKAGEVWFSKYALAFAAAGLERELGMLPEVDWHFERKNLKQAAGGLERFLHHVAAEPLKMATSWAELHSEAARHCVSVEIKTGGLVFRHANRLSIQGSRVARELSKGALEERLGTFVPDAGGGTGSIEVVVNTNETPLPAMETLGGVESLVGWVRRTCGAELERSDSWHQLHMTAATHGLRLVERGRGLAFEATNGDAVKPSSVARGLGRGALEKRLGAFEPATDAVRDVAPKNVYVARPLCGGDALYKRYLMARGHAKAASSQRLGAIKQERRAALANLAEDRKRKLSLAAALYRGSTTRRMWERYVRRDVAKQRKGIEAQAQADRKLAYAEAPIERWMDWLRRQAREGDVEALNALRKRASKEANTRDSVTGANAVQLVGGTAAQRADYQHHCDSLRKAKRRALDATLVRRREALSRQTRKERRRQKFVDLVAKTPLERKLCAFVLLRASGRERQKLQQKFSDKRRAEENAHRVPRWDAWMRDRAARGDAEAQRMAGAPLARLDSVTSEGTVLYQVPGATVRDEGESLTLSNAADLRAASTFLQIAKSKFGEVVAVDGDAEFRVRLIVAAVVSRMEIKFENAEMEQRRVALLHKESESDVGRGNRRGRGAWTVGRGTGRTSARGAEPRAERSRSRTVKSSGGGPRKRPPATVDSLLHVSAQHVVRDGRRSEVLLQSDALDLLQRRAAVAADRVRRAPDGPGLTGVANRKGKRL